MRRLSLVVIAVLLLAPVSAVAQTATPYPGIIPLPNGCWPVGGFQVYSFEPGSDLTLEYNDEYPCNEALRLFTAGYEYVEIRFLLTQYVASSDLRIRMGIQAPAGWIAITTYQPDGTTIVGSQDIWAPGLPDYPDVDSTVDWRLLDFVISADTDYGGYVSFHMKSLLQPFGALAHMAAIHMADNNLAFPVGDCAGVLPTRTATLTIIPTPTGTITQTWTPGPTWAAPSLTPTSTPIPYATWTPTTTPTPWQTAMSTLAAWELTPDASVTPRGTPAAPAALPTWAPWPTVAWPIVPTVEPSVTPLRIAGNMTVTIEGTPGAMATEIYSASEKVESLMTLVPTIESIVDFRRVYSDAYDMTGRIMLPIGLFRGIEPYMPHTYPIISFLLTALFLIALTYAITLAAGAFGLISGALQWVADLIDGILP